MEGNNFMDIDFDSLPVLDNRYSIIKKIGSGATCKVKLAVDKLSGESVAIKILNSQGSNFNFKDKHFVAEIETLKRVNHINIINLKDGNRGTYQKPDGAKKTVDYIVLECASNGELFDYLYFPKQGFGEYFARNLFSQLMEGLQACHDAGVAHRDLKTENIMMDKNWVLKLADFGYATLLQGKKGNGLLETFLGTISYAAPEILSRKPYNGATADIFSCGVILFVLVTGKLPFGKAVVYDTYYRNIVKNDFESYWSVMGPKVGNVSKEFKSLINLMLKTDPTSRPTISEIFKHEWMLKNGATNDELLEEMERRKAVVVYMKRLEAEQALANRGNRGGVYRSGGGTKGEDDELTPIELVKGERLVDRYIESSNPYRVKVSETDPTRVLNDLATYFYNLANVKVKMTPNETHAKMRVAFEHAPEKTENEEEVPELNFENLEFNVEVKRMDDDSLIVEFFKTRGDKMDFFNQYDQLVESLQA